MNINSTFFNAVYNYLDHDSKINLLFVNKESNQIRSLLLLSNLGIKPIENYPPYLQVMGLFRLHCEHFRRKFTIETPCKTLFEAKKIVDSKLSEEEPQLIIDANTLNSRILIAI